VQHNIIIPFDQGDREGCEPITFRNLCPGGGLASTPFYTLDLPKKIVQKIKVDFNYHSGVYSYHALARPIVGADLQ
jgi:hypothetical protein